MAGRPRHRRSPHWQGAVYRPRSWSGAGRTRRFRPHCAAVIAATAGGGLRLTVTRIAFTRPSPTPIPAAHGLSAPDIAAVERPSPPWRHRVSRLARQPRDVRDRDPMTPDRELVGQAWLPAAWRGCRHRKTAVPRCPLGCRTTRYRYSVLLLAGNTAARWEEPAALVRGPMVTALRMVRIAKRRPTENIDRAVTFRADRCRQASTSSRRSRSASR